MKLIKDIFLREQLSDKISKKIVMLSDDAIVVLDNDMNIILMNHEAENIFGYYAEELIGQPYDLLIPEHQRAEGNEILDGFKKGNEARQIVNERGHVLKGLKKGGEEFQTRQTMLKIPEGRQSVLAIILKDISEMKESEEGSLRLLTTDALTGMHNRRHFIRTAECEAQRARRYNRAVSFLIIDLDRFQEFNATNGYEMGDKLLQRISVLCRQTLRNIDILGRWSGGELIALLPETTAENANIIASRLCDLIEEIQLDVNGQKVFCTASIGISEYKKNESNIDLPIARAIKAAAMSKEENGGKVSTLK